MVHPHGSPPSTYARIGSAGFRRLSTHKNVCFLISWRVLEMSDMALRFFVFTLLGLALGSAINGRKPLHSRGAQPYKHTVLAIGDTHKSYNDLVSTLQRAAFLNQDGQWANQDIDSVIHFGVGLNRYVCHLSQAFHFANDYCT